MVEKHRLIVSTDNNFKDLFKKIKGINDKVLLSFDLKEKDLDPLIGKKIRDFLYELKQNQIQFEVSTPLPRCIFGTHYAEIICSFRIPKDCYECKELFTIKDEEIISCPAVNKKGPMIYYLNDKNQIYELFNTLRLKKEPSNKCKRCKYFLRKNCDGLCYRK